MSLTQQDLQAIGNLIEVKFDQKLEEKLEQKLEEKLEQKLEQKLDQKLEEKLEQKLEEKLDKKLEEKLDQKLEEKLDKKLKPIKKDIHKIKNDLDTVICHFDRRIISNITRIERLENHLRLPPVI